MGPTLLPSTICTPAEHTSIFLPLPISRKSMPIYPGAIPPTSATPTIFHQSIPEHTRALAVIDWKDSKFEKDMLYEDIYAPQWIDFSNHDAPVDDEAWFCRPDCDHPKTVEDFFRQRTPNSAKLPRSVSVSEIPEFSDRNRRDAALKNWSLCLI